ncbi:dipeptide ABC transporter ATP-binding protein [Arthrobacter sp.]|uniref:dipeptide ABC transporter ATP-binding protein n=1 Tax=Arthrobacter sp. TaxID=1667 RepID=UPI003A908923
MSTTQAPPVASVRNLRIGFGPADAPVPAVHGIGFDLHAGQCLAIVGESGSGKSVTARTLIGLTGHGARIQADRIELAGEDLRALGDRAWRRVRGDRVGYILQDALVSLDPLRTIGAEIDDSLRLHTRLPPGQRRRRVLQLLEQVGIPDPEQRIRQRSGELSGGLRQRALIASAIAADPALLVADEPTTALDATVQAQILDLLAERKRAGSALLLISHDLAVVAQLADQIAVMQAGQIVESGPASEVLANPRHDYTRRLLRAVPTDKPRGSRLSAEETVISERHRNLMTARAGSHTGGHGEPDVVLNAVNLRKSYRNPDGTDRVAVGDVSFALRRGSTLGIVGESGSGKSTVARMALGLTRPDRGSIEVLGLPWSAVPERERRPRRRHVATIAQDPLGSFDPQWSVGRILADAVSGSGKRSRTAVRDEVAALLETVGLSAQLAVRRPLWLSGGQRQRVSIARALASGPEIIICDEPVSALDVSIQAQVLDLLDALQREFGLSYVFISHDLGVVRHISDEILVMQDGHVVEAGRAEEIFAHPTQDYTRRLLEAAPRLASPTGRVRAAAPHDPEGRP